ncbi:hypothetical protein RB195_004700 [Necator americanus]|uniref:Endonuclease/exonuclease/phosphatase domain-containing protein n=1 Tax=Necator americanus TaxID=51031 RepID=A0ABR1BJ80_NECAM
MPSRCAFLRLRVRRGRKLWIVSAHAPTETAENNSKDVLYDQLNALMSKIPSQQVVIVGIDANAKMGLKQQSDLLGKWYYAAERENLELFGTSRSPLTTVQFFSASRYGFTRETEEILFNRKSTCKSER